MSELELSGFRLNSVRFSSVFDFVKSAPKKTEYIVTYDMPKDRTPCMYEYEQKLLAEYSASKIPAQHTDYDIFRITNKVENLQEIKDYRKRYFKRVLFQQLLISLVFLLLGIFMFIAMLIQKPSPIISALICIYAFVSLIVFLYKVFGFVKQSRKILGG